MGAAYLVYPNDRKYVNNLSSRTPPAFTDNYAALDSGCTDDFLKANSPHTNRQVATRPITVTIPSGAGIRSSHTCDIHLTDMPARQGHILPDLVHSLLSVGKFCDDGYQVLFDRNKCAILRNHKPILQGHRDPVSRLWLMPLAPPSNERHPTLEPSQAYGLSASSSSTKSELLQFLHASAFSPVPSTLIHAITKNHFVTWPGLTTKAVRRHLPKSLATAQGHLDRQRRNTRSTKAPPPATPEEITQDLQPTPIQQRSNAVFTAYHLVDAHNGVIYTDPTGAFPVTSRAGHKYLLVLYDFDSNAILAEPMKARSDDEALRAYEALYNTLTTRGCKPSLNILDNEASRAIKRAITSSGATFQLVEPHNHRVNAAERAIRTFKNHFIAGLCSTDPSFPVYLWDELVPQALLTLNLLRTSRLNPPYPHTISCSAFSTSIERPSPHRERGH